ncbi:MAG: hypothetical protein U1F83_10830 [Verrucomicrobiota bacterium]
MQLRLKNVRLLAMNFLTGLTLFAHAQTPSQPNPLMQLMLTQPPIDVTSPVVVEASFDPPAVRPGQKAIYRLSLNAIASNVRLPEQIPAPPQLEFRSGAQGQILRSVGNSLQPLTSINYEVRGKSPGMFLVPAFYIEVYGKQVVVPAAGLEVAADVDVSQSARQLLVRAAATNLYVGEPVAVQVLLPATPPNSVENVREMQINGDGLLMDKNSFRQTIGMTEVNGRNVAAFIYETTVTPIAAGSLSLSAQGFAAGRDFSGPIVISGQVTIPGGPPQYVLLDSEPVTLNVRMLPPEGELPGFKGAIGQLSCDPPQLVTNTVKVGEPLELFVAVRANVNLSRLVPPEPPRVRGWQSFPAVNRGYVMPGQGTNAGVIFAFTFIPLSDELRATPAIPFSAFDPQRGVYVDLTIPAVPIKVVPDASYTNALAWADPVGGDGAAARKLVLSGIVTKRGKETSRLQPLQLRGWFIAIQIAPVFVLGGLWMWERRRRYLEQHPEVVRCRRARRELRRVKRRLQQAALAGAAADFTECGVKALRIACAPHYPANPQALVCADVLEVMPVEERQGPSGEIVRRLFAAADAVNFSGSAGSPGELLTLRQGLEAVLLKLEARL